MKHLETSNFGKNYIPSAAKKKTDGLKTPDVKEINTMMYFVINQYLHKAYKRLVKTSAARVFFQLPVFSLSI